MSAQFNNTINANSTPVYGYFPIYIFSSNYWDAQDWIAWHTAMVAMWDKATANTKFLAAWNASPMLAANISWRNSLVGGDASFIAYAKANGFYDGLFSGVLGTVANVESTAGSTVSSVTNTIGNLAQAAEDWSKYLVPIMVVALIIFSIFYFKKQKLI